MNKTKLITLSLMTAATLTMVGCGSSSSTTTVTPPADTNDTNTTPVVVVPDYAKPAPISAISAQVLVNNAPAIQTSNMAMALTTSMTSAMAAAITEAGAIALINNFAGDAQCAAITAGGSGSIHAEAHSLAAGGNGYTIDFNNCKLDTGVTLAETTQGVGSLLDSPECTTAQNRIEDLQEASCDGTVRKMTEANFQSLQEDIEACLAVTKDQLEYRYPNGEMDQMVADLVYVTGLAAEFADAADEAGLHQEGELIVLAINNDILTINNTLKAEANWVPVGGNIWKTTFNAESFSAVVTDKTEATSKITIAMGGNLAGDLSLASTIDLNTMVRTLTASVSGTNNLSSTAETALPNQGTGIFVSFGIIGEAATYNAGFDMTFADPTNDGFINIWQEHVESNFNDSGDGHMVAYFDNHQNAYHGEVNLYNKAFVQERKLTTDPLAVNPTGVAREATLDINGEFGMNTAGIPFVINTQGAFTFVTNTTASRTILNDNTTTPNLAGGFMTVSGTGGAITFEFSPNSDILMSVNGGLHTQLNANTALWIRSFPQP